MNDDVEQGAGVNPGLEVRLVPEGGMDVVTSGEVTVAAGMASDVPLRLVPCPELRSVFAVVGRSDPEDRVAWSHASNTVVIRRDGAAPVIVAIVDRIGSSDATESRVRREFLAGAVTIVVTQAAIARGVRLCIPSREVISGRTVDGQGVPVVGASVRLGRTSLTTTGRGGRFTIPFIRGLDYGGCVVESGRRVGRLIEGAVPAHGELGEVVLRDSDGDSDAKQE